MTDIRADDDDVIDDGDRLPWLEAVEDDDDERGPSAGKLVAFVLVGLVAVGLIVGGLFWIGNRDSGPAGGEPELIAAPEGSYKVKPDDPGGMQVEGQGDTAFAASAGAEPKGKIDTSAVPEAPVAKAPAPAPSARPTEVAQAPQPKAAPTPKASPATPPAGSGGATIQLGAFSTQSAANAAWKALSSRFSYLAPLAHSVTPVTTGGRTLYRLRANGAGATDVCGRLRVAGEQCVVV